MSIEQKNEQSSEQKSEYLTEEKPEKQLIETLLKKGMTLSAAESCTGGLVAKRLTDIPGASGAFLGGVVSYTNQVKRNVLGVSKATIDRYTEVSAACATEMACGVREKLGTDIGVATTGIAGPDGGTPECPVGTVFIAISWQDKIWVENLGLSPDFTRGQIRDITAAAVMKRVLEKVF